MFLSRILGLREIDYLFIHRQWLLFLLLFSVHVRVASQILPPSTDTRRDSKIPKTKEDINHRSLLEKTFGSSP